MERDPFFRPGPSETTVSSSQQPRGVPPPNWIQFRRHPENRPPKGWTKLPRRSSEHLNLDPEAPKNDVLGILFLPFLTISWNCVDCAPAAARASNSRCRAAVLRRICATLTQTCFYMVQETHFSAICLVWVPNCHKTVSKTDPGRIPNLCHFPLWGFNGAQSLPMQ